VRSVNETASPKLVAQGVHRGNLRFCPECLESRRRSRPARLMRDKNMYTLWTVAPHTLHLLTRTGPVQMQHYCGAAAVARDAFVHENEMQVGTK
jgi:hypothetical protein